MGRLIVSSQSTLDGVTDQIEGWFNKHGEHDWDRSAGRASIDQLRGADAMLLGRKNYEGLSSVWPTMNDEVGFAERVNGMPKYVASRTLKPPLEWNATLLEGELAESVAALKASRSSNLVSFGFGELARSLVAEGLVDELRFWFNPYVWGEGTRAFPGAGPLRLELVSTSTFDTGIVLLTYRPR
jgi:dihydrofolate reductase